MTWQDTRHQSPPLPAVLRVGRRIVGPMPSASPGKSSRRKLAFGVGCRLWDRGLGTERSRCRFATVAGRCRFFHRPTLSGFPDRPGPNALGAAPRTAFWRRFGGPSGPQQRPRALGQLGGPWARGATRHVLDQSQTDVAFTRLSPTPTRQPVAPSPFVAGDRTHIGNRKLARARGDDLL